MTKDDIELFKKLNNACEKKYKVCYKINGCEEWITGELINYNFGNLIIYNEEKEVLYHIPFDSLKWLLPIKKENI